MMSSTQAIETIYFFTCDELKVRKYYCEKLVISVYINFTSNFSKMKEVTTCNSSVKRKKEKICPKIISV
jgi:hypothetical protein